MVMAPDLEILEDSDPIKASYDVFIRPQLKEGRMLYVLQFPNRGLKQDYTSMNNTTPLEVRLKPKSGLVEMDVPFDIQRNFDQGKGVKWGSAMIKSSTGRGGGGASHGLPGGFGIGGATVGRVRRGTQDGEEKDEVLGAFVENYQDLVKEDRVLRKQTLGGQTVPKENTTPQYMIGAFYQNQLHLTPVDQIVQMRPQFHHIDAQQDVNSKAKPPVPSIGRAAEPRAIHMTVKATVDGEEETTDTMAERIRAAQEEPWKRLKFVDQDTEQAWETYKDDLFVENTDTVARLVSSLGNAEFLDAISAPRDAARLSRMKKVKRGKTRARGKGKGKGKEVQAADDEDSEDSMTLSDLQSDIEMGQ